MTRCGKTGKIRYRTEHDAMSGAAGTRRKGRDDVARVYQCPHCRGWHLTKVKDATRYAA